MLISIFPLNIAHSICGLSWQKVIKTILIFHTILKLLNNNFLYILLETQSVAYLHSGLSKWHETQVTTSTWALEALWKMINLNPPRPFDWFATNFESSICGQNLLKAFTCVTSGGMVYFDALPLKPSSHYNFHIQFATLQVAQTCRGSADRWSKPGKCWLGSWQWSWGSRARLQGATTLPRTSLSWWWWNFEGQAGSPQRRRYRIGRDWGWDWGLGW